MMYYDCQGGCWNQLAIEIFDNFILNLIVSMATLVNFGKLVLVLVKSVSMCLFNT